MCLSLCVVDILVDHALFCIPMHSNLTANEWLLNYNTSNKWRTCQLQTTHFFLPLSLSLIFSRIHKNPNLLALTGPNFFCVTSRRDRFLLTGNAWTCLNPLHVFLSIILRILCASINRFSAPNRGILFKCNMSTKYNATNQWVNIISRNFNANLPKIKEGHLWLMFVRGFQT